MFETAWPQAPWCGLEVVWERGVCSQDPWDHYNPRGVSERETQVAPKIRSASPSPGRVSDTGLAPKGLWLSLFCHRAFRVPHPTTTTSILASLENSPHSNICSLPVTHQKSKSQSNLDCKLTGNRNHTRSLDHLSFEFPELFFYTTQIAFLSFPSLVTVRAYLASSLETASS